MANEVPESLPPPKLKVSRAEAAQKIKAQIEKGYDIRAMVIHSLGDLAQVRSAQSKWHTYNMDLLSRLFENVSVAESSDKTKIDDTSYSSITSIEDARNIFRKNLGMLISQWESLLERLELIPEPTQANTSSALFAQNGMLRREIFIVHGHDEAAKESVARVLSQLDLKPIILNEKADAGQTVIEKFEKHANVAFAVVLLTPDDIGCAKKQPDQQKPRARQNVILEFGYFLGRLGRGKVCALYKEGVELPSDLYGILYVSMDASGAWKFRLAKEISQAGIKVDINVLLAD